MRIRIASRDTHTLSPPLTPSHSLAGIVNNCSIPGESIQVARADRRRGGSNVARQQSGSSTGPQSNGRDCVGRGERTRENKETETESTFSFLFGFGEGGDRAETNDPLHTPREREIKHCATVFHPETSAKREASPSHSHASTARRLAGSRCTKRRC